MVINFLLVFWRYPNSHKGKRALKVSDKLLFQMLK